MRSIGLKLMVFTMLTGLTFLPFAPAYASSGKAAAASGVTQRWEPVTSAAADKKGGILAWLESFLPDGIRFTSLMPGSQRSAETLAEAECFNSGAGVSCNGFDSLEDYLAAVKVSEDLNIPIHKLRDRMQQDGSLTKAIQELRPGANASMEAFRAEQEARAMLKKLSS